MAYNFKSIADVEVVAEPTESANVLIEENGVIKKAPKTAVGGNGGGGFDFVIRQSQDDWRVGNLVIGTYEDIYNKFTNNEFIVGFYWGTSFNSAGYNIDMCREIYPDEDNGKPVFVVWFHQYGDTARIYEDNTVKFHSTD